MQRAVDLFMLPKVHAAALSRRSEQLVKREGTAGSVTSRMRSGSLHAGF